MRVMRPRVVLLLFVGAGWFRPTGAAAQQVPPGISVMPCGRDPPHDRRPSRDTAMKTAALTRTMDPSYGRGVMSSPWVLALVGALLVRCQGRPGPLRRPPLPVTPAPIAATMPAPPAPRSPRPSWTAAFRLRNRPLTTHALHDVIVHAPPGFDAGRPFDVVILFHGMGTRASWWVVAGALAPVTGEAGGGWGLAARHDRARVNALLVAPQLAPRGLDNFSGAFQRPGFLRAFLSELLEEKLVERLGGRRSLDDVGSLTLVGSSAGGPTIAGLLARRELIDRVRNVVVMDGLYGGEATFAAWLASGTTAAPRRFVCVHGGQFAHVATMTALLRAHRVDFVEQPRGALGDAVRGHRAVFATAGCEHVGMTSATYDKILPALGLPPREVEPDEATRAVVRVAAPSAGTLTVGAAARGSFAPGDAMLDDWTLVDDWSLALDAGQRVRIDARGGRSWGGLCARHDVELAVLDGDRVIAHDDDGGGAMDARLELAAPHAGTFTVRVLEHDTWAARGEYSVRVGAAP